MNLRRLAPLLLALAVSVPFLPALQHQFVWDDFPNLVANPRYRGLGWPQLRWMLSAVHVGHYVPVTWLSFGLDYRLWGMDARGYHFTNVLLHAVNAALFFAVARRLLARAGHLTGWTLEGAAATAALFFGVHPLRAESVAWVTERRDVLSGAFVLLAVLAYLRAVEAAARRRSRLLLLSVVAYAAALGAKSIVMTLPAILLVMDVYPLRRLPGPGGAWFGGAARRVWIEKLPYVGLSALAALIAYQAQFLERSLGTYPWPTRVHAAVYGLWHYVSHTVLPRGLSPLYEVPVPLDPGEARFVAAWAGVLGISAVVLALRRRWPAGLALWLAYGIALSPVSGIVVRAGFQMAADRYSYLACLGWALAAGAGVGVLAEGARRSRSRLALGGIAALVATWLLGLGALTWGQVGVWRDSGTLWGHAVRVTPACALCHANLGLWLLGRGGAAAAAEHFQRALALRPDRWRVHQDLGLALGALGRWPDAVAQYRLVLARDPDAVSGRVDLAAALQHVGDLDGALRELERARILAPGDPAVQFRLGLLLLDRGRLVDAAATLRRAVDLAPTAVPPRVGLIRAYLAAGQPDLARESHEALKGLDPAAAARLGPLVPATPHP